MRCRLCYDEDGFPSVRVFETGDDDSARRRAFGIAGGGSAVKDLEEVDELNMKIRDIPATTAA